MNKRDLLKAIIKEAVQRNLAEMPQIKRFYTLTDDWENNLSKIENLKSTNKYKEVKNKIEAFRDKNHFSNDDIMASFGFKRPQSSNAFIKLMLDSGVIMRVDGAKINKIDTSTNQEDDEWSIDLDTSSDLVGDIDIASVLRKVNLDKNYRILYVVFTDKPHGYPKAQFKTTRYRFLKPFLEKGYYKNIPSQEIVKLVQPDRWNSPELNILDLFPSKQAFYDFVEENPSVFASNYNPTTLPPIEDVNAIKMFARKS